MIKKQRLLLLIIYCLSYLMNAFFYVDVKNVFGEAPIINTNIVAIIVDKKLYENNNTYEGKKIKDEIEWYAKYIQTKISTSKATVISIDTNNFKARDISKMLENIYFDGIKGKTSNLLGVILVGDIALPVVKQDNFIFPSIYPYVDFESQKYIFDSNSKYFIYNNNPSGQAELRHSIIKYSKEADYIRFFEKLKKYDSDPETFISKKIWYDDIIALKKYFSKESLNGYINNFLFTEDVGYHRYNKLMLDIFQASQNKEATNMAQGLAIDNSTASADEIKANSFNDDGSQSEESKTFMKSIEKVVNILKKFGFNMGGSNGDVVQDPYSPSGGGSSSSSSTQNKNSTIPTLSLKKIIDPFFKSYTELLGGNYLSTMNGNITAVGRRNGMGINGHLYKISQKDSWILGDPESGVQPLLIQYNGLLETALDKKIEDEKYYMKIPTLVSYQDYKDEKKRVKIVTRPPIYRRKCVTIKNDTYKNFYFGTETKDLTNAKGSSIYVGAFRNLKGLSGVLIQDGKFTSSENKSIGGSYNLFATQVEANRGYNLLNSQKEVDLYSGNKDYAKRNLDCVKYLLPRFKLFCTRQAWTNDGDDMESIEQFARRNRGGASPINLNSGLLNQGIFKLTKFNYKEAQLPIYDIAGSQKLDTAEENAYSFSGLDKYKSVIYKSFKDGYRRTSDKYSSENLNFFSIYSGIPSSDLKFGQLWKTFKIKTNSNSPDPTIDGCNKDVKIYEYKNIDSRVKNTATEQIDIIGYDKNDFATGGKYRVYYDFMKKELEGYNTTNNITLINSGINSLNNEIKGINDRIIEFDTSSYDVDTLTSGISGFNRILPDTISQSINNYVTYTQVELDKLNDTVGAERVEQFYILFDQLDQEERATNIKTKLLSGWFTRLMYMVKSAKTQFGSIDSTLQNTIDTNFNDTNTYDLKLKIKIQVLNAKRNNINGKQSGVGECGQDIPCGCTKKYSAICDKIKKLIESEIPTVTSVPNIESKIREIGVNKVLTEEGGEGERRIFEDIKESAAISRDLLSQLITDMEYKKNNLYPFRPSKVSRFKIMDNETIEHIDGLNTMTQDRPIDSPRYITFQGIGGSLVSFTYPNLYYVEVFKEEGGLLKLKTIPEIKQAIINYLTGKVQEYNNKLTDQLVQRDKETSFYNQNKVAFTFLKEHIDPLANPNRDYPYYQYMLPNYFIDAIGAKGINDLTELLYYQNLPVLERKPETKVIEDINNINATFDINNKIGYVTSTYLQQNSHSGETINTGVVIPTYDEGGYEVAYINSDGLDYISTKDKPSVLKDFDGYSQRFQERNQLNITPEKPKSDQENKLDDECKIDPSGAVMINKRPKAFACRLKQTIKSPAQIKFDFSSAQGPVLDFDKVKSAIATTTEDGLVTGATDYYDGSSLENNVNNAQIDEIDKQSETTNSVQIAFQSTDEDNNLVMKGLTDTEAVSMQDILQYTVAEVSGSDSRLLPDDTDTIQPKQISIYSTKNVGDVTLKITATGNNCFELLGQGEKIDLCKTFSASNLNLFFTGQVFNLDFEKVNSKIKTGTAGISLLTFEFCKGSTCVKKTKQVNIIPGGLDKAKIITPTTGVIAGGMLPIVVIGYDKYENRLGQQLENYRITTAPVSTKTSKKMAALLETNLEEKTIGEISDGAQTSSGIYLNHFGRANFLYYAPKPAEVIHGQKFNIVIKKGDGSQFAIGDDITILKGELKIIQDGKVYNVKEPESTIYNLPNSKTEISYKDEYGVSQINETKLPKITISFTGEKNELLDTLASVSSRNGLLQPGIIQNTQEIVFSGLNQNTITKTTFFPNGSIFIRSGKAEIYLNPNFKAGEDTIEISVPGLEPVKINFKVNPGPARIINMGLDTNAALVDEEINGELNVTDVYGNEVANGTIVKLISTKVLKILSSKRVNGKYQFKIKAQDPGGEGFIYASITTDQKGNPVGMGEQMPAYQSVVVQKSILPKENLNIMYLNLFGTDWGNQRGYFSKNKNIINDIMSGSNKVLATTTLLVDPAKLKSIDFIISSGGQIKNTAGNDTTLGINSGNLEIQVNNIGNITIGEQKIFSLQTTSIENIKDTLSNSNNIVFLKEDGDSLTNITSNTNENTISVNDQVVLDLKKGDIVAGLQITLSEETIEGYNVWNVTFVDKNIGKLIISNLNGKLTINQNNKYGIINIFSDGSTNGEKGIGIYNKESVFSESNKGYKSIEDSIDPKAYIGFRGDFKNITYFGEGKTVGESTVPFGSEFLINFGDPLLTRISKNENVENTDFDFGLGQNIYSDPSKTIFKTLTIDFNNDGLKDIAVAYTDGTIKLLKNYGGNKPYKNLQNLTILSDGIQDLFVGDVDGNGFQDIIVRTTNNQFRAYTNENGIFDVDGKLVCLDVYGGPEKVDKVNEIFVQDMNADSAIDIITNDQNGDIKIFYGGKMEFTPYYISDQLIKELPNYVSSSKYTCDDRLLERQSQEKGTIKLVKHFGIKLLDAQIKDESLVRRQGIEGGAENSQDNAHEGDILYDADMSNGISKIESKYHLTNLDPETFTLTEYKGLNYYILDAQIIEGHDLEGTDIQLKFNNTATLPNYNLVLDSSFLEAQGIRLKGGSSSTLDFENDGNTSNNDLSIDDIQSMIGDLNAQGLDNEGLTQSMESVNKFVANPLSQMVPIYETLPSDQIKYMPISYLSGDDPVGIFKTYENLSGDELKVGDIVKVRVYIYAYKNIKITYIDQILGPWSIEKKSEGKIKSFSIADGTWTRDIKPHRNVSYGYEYMIDNINLTQGDMLNFSYNLKFKGSKDTIKIEVKDIENSLYNNLPDIKVIPKDSCAKWVQAFFNNSGKNNKEYEEKLIDIQAMMGQYYNNLQTQGQNALGGLSSSLASIDTNNFGNGTIPGLDSVLEKWTDGNLLDGLMDQFTQGNNQVNLGNFTIGLPKELEAKINGKIDNALKTMCEGFKLGAKTSCQGPPVPFNQAFLAPGKYHIFGCKPSAINKALLPLDQVLARVDNTLGKGVPALYIPGRIPIGTPPYIPFIGSAFLPVPNKGLGDGFWGLSVSSPNLGSQVRIYLAPTLTMQLGIALCVGPYILGSKIPKLLRDLGGNCVVTTVNLLPGCGAGAGVTTGNASDQELDPRMLDASAIGECSNPPKIGGYATKVPNGGVNNYEYNIGEYEIIQIKKRYNDHPEATAEQAFQRIKDNPGNRTRETLVGFLNDVGDTASVQRFKDYPAASTIQFLDRTKDKPINWSIDKLKGFGDKIGSVSDKIGLTSIGNGAGEVISSVFQLTSKGADSLTSTPIVGGAISFTQQATTETEEVSDYGMVQLEAGPEITNKRLGGIIKGLPACIIKNRLDRQEEYILNNLTQMTIGVTLPDPKNLTKGFGAIRGGMKSGGIETAVNVTQAYNHTVEALSKDNRKNIPKNTVEGIKNLVKNKSIQQSLVSEKLTKAVNNPFDTILKSFKNVPLINLSTKNVNIKVPFIYQEDINKYISYTTGRIATNSGIIAEREKFLGDAMGFCGNKEKIKKIKGLKGKFNQLTQDLKDQLNPPAGNITKTINNINKSLSQSKNVLLGLQNIKNGANVGTEKKVVSLSIKASTAYLQLMINKDYLNGATIQKELDALLETKLEEIAIDMKYENDNKADTDETKLKANDLKKSIKDSQDYTTKITNEKNIKIMKVIKGIPTSIKNIQAQLDSLESKVYILKQETAKTNIDNSITQINTIIKDTALILENLGAAISGGEKYKKCTDIFQRVDWNVKIDIFTKLKDEFTQTTDSVRKNIKVLKLYKEFPAKLYERMHVTDRYLSEISSILSNFVGTINNRLKINSTRYSQYVDSIILMIGMIKTWQVVVDFSVNRSEKCSKCTIDTYDSYTCGLSFLCPKLPILPIPPFKIPNIRIDLSNINLGIDILLPKFNFVPTSIPLPKIPNLPRPPEFNFDININLDVNLDLNINIPKIGVLPAPPELPPLPSFIPNVKITLPVLPPAPKIPKLIPEINMAVSLAEVFGKIYCILKGNGIPLVAEKGVKARIEQLSQRTREVPFFDNFDLNKIANFKDPPLQGFDYEINAFVNMQFNFEGIYTFIDSIAEVSNQAVTNVSEKLDIASQQVSSYLNNNIVTDIFADIEDGTIVYDYKDYLTKLEDTNSGSDESIDIGSDLILGENLQDMLQYTQTKVTTGIWDKATPGKIDIVSTKNVGTMILKISSTGDNCIQIKSGKDLINTCKNEFIRIFNPFFNPLTLDGKIELNIEGNTTVIFKLCNGETTCTEKSKIIRSQKLSVSNSIKKQDSDSTSGWLDYNVAYKLLKDGLLLMKRKAEDKKYMLAVNKILSIIENRSVVKPQFEKINKIHNQAQKIIKDKQDETRKLAEQIKNDYDGFLNTLNAKPIKLVDDEKLDITLSTNLMSLDQGSEKILLSQNNPGKDYLAVNKKLINGYLSAIKSHDAMTLRMDQKTYDKTKNYLQDLNNKIDEVGGLFEKNIEKIEVNKNTQVAYNNTTNNVQSQIVKKLIAQNDGTTCADCGQGGGYSMDLSSYIKGIFVKGNSGKMINVVNSEENISKIGSNYFIDDLNEDGTGDLIMRDDKNIYVKYANQSGDYGKNISYDGYYDISFESPGKGLENSDKGYYNIGNKDKIDLKFFDKNYEVKNFKMAGQDFDSISFSWTNNNSLGDGMSGYLIQLDNRVDVYNDKDQILKKLGISFEENLNSRRYILVLPEGTSLTGATIDLGLTEKIISNLMTGTIFDVKYFGPNTKNINITLHNMPKTWKYAKIVNLKSANENLSPDEIEKGSNNFETSSTWSNQIVLGSQILGDMKGPEGETILYRPAIDQVIGTGDTLDGFVSTRYTLKAIRQDNVAVSKMRIDYKGQTIKVLTGKNITGEIDLELPIFSGKTVEKYTFGASDFNDNISINEVTVKINIPTIEIIKTGIVNEKFGQLIAKISNDIDSGFVSFSRKRNNMEQILTGTDKEGGYGESYYKLSPLQTVVTGGYYEISDDIGLYLPPPDGKRFATLNQKNGEIKIDQGFESKVVFSSQIPVIELTEISSQTILFRIALPSESLIKIETGTNTNTQVIDLVGGNYGDFEGGKYIKNDNAELYVNKKGTIYVPANYSSSLTAVYSFSNGNVTYTIKDQSNNNIAAITVKIKPLVGTTD